MKLRFETILDNLYLTSYLKNNDNIDILSINAKVSGSDLLFSDNNSSTVIYSDQIKLPFKSISLIKNIIKQDDVSLNSNTTPITTKAFIIATEYQTTLYTFLDRYGYSHSSVTDAVINTLPDFYTVTIGVYKSSTVTSNDALVDIDNTCFDWYSFSELLALNDKKTFNTLLIKYKYTINLNTIRNWINSNFKSSLNSLITELSNGTSNSSSGLNFNFIIYPPAVISGKLEEPLKIIKPTSILTSKVLDKVIFKVSDSYSNVVDRIYEIEFTDSSNSNILYTTNSVLSSENFILDTVPFSKHYLNTSTSTQYSYKRSINPIISNNIITFLIPETIQKILSNNLNYTIKVKETDLTSQRS